MGETRDDIREALARCINPETFAEGSPDYYGPNDRLAWASAGQRVALKTADKCLSGPLAPILAQVSALQAEVERLQKVEDELADVSEQASRWLEACDELRERLQKVEGEREKGRVPSGPGYSSSAPSPQAVSASGEYPSRGGTAKAFADAICDGYPAVRDDVFVRVDNPRWAPGNGEDPYIVTKAHDAVRVLANRIDLLKMDHAAEIERLTLRLINGPANPQECSEFCRVAREDGDGKPCLDCHPENFTF